MKFGEELISEIKASLDRCREERERRERNIAECLYDSTDSFLSEWANGLTTRLEWAKLEILENKGLAEFTVLCDLEGNVVADKLIRTRFGSVFNVNGQWINPHVKTSTLEKKGFRIETRLFPAWACIEGKGTGLSGNCWVKVFRSRVNYFTGEEVEKNLSAEVLK